ncbi:tetratricopeptide repeat protein [Actinomadura chokoriensis]|uniref:Tetratricopeptide repeat protein n=1 Tax=Actinomadura chokoriensis TaxID=454156 RepID=A0ABV4QRU8_9ACTN
MTSELERDLPAGFHRHRSRCEYAEAEAELRAAAGTGAGEADLELGWGRLEFDRRDHPAALRHFVRAVEVDPSCDEAVAWRVAALGRLYHFEEARRVAEEGLRDFPGSAHIGVALGRVFDEWENPVEALVNFDRVLEGHPEDEKALEWRVFELLMLNRYTESESAAEAALALYPDSPGILDSAARLYATRHQYDSALECYDKVLRVHPDEEDALRGRIRTLRGASRYDEARAAAEDAAGVLPGSADIWLQWSYIEEDAGDLARALELAVHATRLAPRSEDAHGQRVDVLRKLHRHAEADEVADRAIEALPRSPGLLAVRAWSRSGAGRYEEMLADCERALEIHDRHAIALDGRATALRKLRRYAEAGTAIAEAVRALPHSSRLHNEWGLLLDDRQRYAEALKRFDIAADVDPFNLFALRWRIVELRKMGRFAEAHEAADVALERGPTVLLYAEIGNLYAEQDRFTEALTEYRRALDLDPGYGYAHGQLGYVLRRLRRFREAEEAARKAIERLPHDAHQRWSLGWAYISQDLDEAGLAEFRRAVELDPDDAWFQAQVGQALWYLNRYGEAESFIRDALRTQPDNVDLRSQLGQILLYQHRYDAALEEFTRAEGAEVSDLTAMRIATLRAAGLYEEAEVLARDAVRRRPDIAALYTELRLVYSDRGRYAEAEATLRDGMRVLPASAELTYALFDLYEWLGRHEEVVAECERLLAENPQQVDPARIRIDNLETLRRYPEAIQAAEEALSRHPSLAPFAVQLGWLHYERGEYDEALAAFERAAGMEPSRWACYGRANTLAKLGRHGEAVMLLRAEIGLRPNYAQTWTELADVCEDEGRYEDALGAAEQATRVDPYNRPAVEARLVALRHLQRWDEAESVAREALDRIPRNPELTIALGRVLDDQNRYVEALAQYDRALELKPMLNTALVAKSSTLRSLRRFAEAEHAISPAIERYPIFTFLRAELGWIHRDQGRRGEACRVFERLREAAVSPAKRAEACIGLGWVAFTGDDHQTAARHFREACAADARSRDAKVGLAWALAGQDDKERWAEAERLCLDVLGTRPDDLLAHTCLGVLYYRRGEYAAAEHHLRRTIELDPYDGGYVDLGALYVQLGRFTEAEELLGKALDRDWYDAQAHIEYGNLCLQWEGDEAEVAARGRQAVRHFRQALSISPASAPAAIGLAIGLTRAPGDFPAAERVLRDAIDRIGDGPSRAGLLLALARLLIERGDLTQRPELYREAVTTAQEAIDRAGTEAEAHFVAGVAMYKVGASDEVRARPFYRRRAVRYLRECVRRDPAHVEGRRLLLLARENLKTARGGAVGSFVMTVVAMSLLITMWVSLFFSDRITTVMLTTLTPVLVGLVALGFVLPLLVRLKLPGGVEADLSASLQQVSSGPTGDMSIGPGRIGGQGGETMSMAPFPAGPRGQLPRLE